MRRSILVSLSAATVAAVFLATGASVDAQRVGPRGVRAGRLAANVYERPGACVYSRSPGAAKSVTRRAGVAGPRGWPIGSI